MVSQGRLPPRSPDLNVCGFCPENAQQGVVYINNLYSPSELEEYTRMQKEIYINPSQKNSSRVYKLCSNCKAYIVEEFRHFETLL